MTEHPIATWHRMVQDRSGLGLDALLDENVVFLSPVVHAPQVGRTLTATYPSRHPARQRASPNAHGGGNRVCANACATPRQRRGCPATAGGSG